MLYHNLSLVPNVNKFISVTKYISYICIDVSYSFMILFKQTHHAESLNKLIHKNCGIY